MRLKVVLLSGLLCQASAFQLPFSIPFLSRTQGQVPLSAPSSPSPPPVNRIAIIGAGAGGSSAAFWIAKGKEQFGLDIEIDVFDNNSYIGGRSTVVYPYDDQELEPMELGGSIFVRANKNLWRAAEEFDLERFDFGDNDGVTGIWDGSQFVFTSGGAGWFYESWWDTIKVLWRYGYKAPQKTKSIVDSMINKYVTIYDPSHSAPFPNITALSAALDLTDLHAQTTSEFFDAQAIDARWTRELVEAATRVNYGHNVDELHALEGLCSLAASGASSIKGGNRQIFQNFITRSKAEMHYNTTVKRITRQSPESPLILHTEDPSGKAALPYRAVILAAPYHSSGISLSLPASSTLPVIPPQPYVHLHVTLLSTHARTPNPAYFGLKAGASVPTMILTTFEGVRQGGKEPEFNSLSYHGKIARADGEERAGEHEYLVKIFSTKRVEDAWLSEMFGEVGWVHRKEWEAYPVLPPTTTFPPIKLDKGLYYVNAFEPLISTMETETVASRNVVELLLQEEYGASICKKYVPVEDTGDESVPKLVESPSANPNFVYGWDC